MGRRQAWLLGGLAPTRPSAPRCREHPWDSIVEGICGRVQKGRNWQNSGIYVILKGDNGWARTLTSLLRVKYKRWLEWEVVTHVSGNTCYIVGATCSHVCMLGETIKTNLCSSESLTNIFTSYLADVNPVWDNSAQVQYKIQRNT